MIVQLESNNVNSLALVLHYKSNGDHKGGAELLEDRGNN